MTNKTVRSISGLVLVVAAGCGALDKPFDHQLTAVLTLSTGESWSGAPAVETPVVQRVTGPDCEPATWFAIRSARDPGDPTDGLAADAADIGVYVAVPDSGRVQYDFDLESPIQWQAVFGGEPVWLARGGVGALVEHTAITFIYSVTEGDLCDLPVDRESICTPGGATLTLTGVALDDLTGGEPLTTDTTRGVDPDTGTPICGPASSGSSGD